MLGFEWAGRKVLPMSLRRPGFVAEPLNLGWLLHGELRWTQGEKLHLSEAFVAGPRGSAGERVVLFRRDALRSQRGLTGARRLPLPHNSPSSAVLRGSETARAEACSVGQPALVASAGASGCPQEDGQPTSPANAELLQTPSRSGRATGEDRGMEEVFPHTRRLLLASSRGVVPRGGVRQFEFHPSRPGTLLAGRKDGVIAILDHEADTQTHVLEVDSYPILGLSWLHTQPQWAVVGASQSGTTCMVRYDESKPGCMEHVRLEPFPHLSSLSVNCTDDFFMTSGFCVDVGLYDMGTGRKMTTFRGLHQNFINILRFATRSPHLFATASFDHTCKLWDLREPINAGQPARLFNTDTLNVMCCFSPDDGHILCSGVDKALQRFPLAHNDDSRGTRFPLPALHSDTNYRRSLFLADGKTVVTAATNESLLRLYTAEAPHRHLGHIDFKGMLLRRARASRLPTEEYVQSLRCHPTDPHLLGVLLSTSEPHPESYISMVRLEK